ncbi:hypothetical protein AHAS_Ahas07G0127100 [Arachis hypogaea]
MVDLPGITRVPVHGQPENIYDQIKDIIMEYIRPEESIILNVLSTTVDFTTCESIRMSQNRIGDKSYEEARIEEERLFESHPMLSKIDKSIVGVPVLAQRLVQVQGMIISKLCPKL